MRRRSDRGDRGVCSCGWCSGMIVVVVDVVDGVVDRGGRRCRCWSWASVTSWLIVVVVVVGDVFDHERW